MTDPGAALHKPMGAPMFRVTRWTSWNRAVAGLPGLP